MLNSSMFLTHINTMTMHNATEHEETRAAVLAKIRDLEAEVKTRTSSVRIAEAELENICVEILRLLDAGFRSDKEPISKQELIEMAKKPDGLAQLTNELIEECDKHDKKVRMNDEHFRNIY